MGTVRKSGVAIVFSCQIDRVRMLEFRRITIGNHCGAGNEVPLTDRRAFEIDIFRCHTEPTALAAPQEELPKFVPI